MIKCLICGKELNRVTHHLMNQHKMTKQQYLKRFPEADLISKESIEKNKAYCENHKNEIQEYFKKSYKRNGLKKNGNVK